jgi:hypothetical protein
MSSWYVARVSEPPKPTRRCVGPAWTNVRVLDGGMTDWEKAGFAVRRGAQRWALERQVRLVAGSIVLSSVIGSTAVPRLKWLAALIGGG